MTLAVTLASLLAALMLGLAAPAAAIDRPDPWITTKVKIALLTAEGVYGIAIHVDTIDGRVSLYGRVSSAAEKQKAGERARSVEGVREVRNLIQVVPPGRQEAVAALDQEVQQRVEQALAEASELADSDIEVTSVADGVVLLSGEAATLSDHRLALEVARSQPGVERVATQIRSPDQLTDAELWYEGAEPGPTLAKDLYVTSAAKVRLMANQATPALDIDVDTREGVVTLFGAVPSEAARKAAEAEVREVRWVRGVENKLQVVPPESKQQVSVEDETILKQVREVLAERDVLDSSQIEVEVSNHVVRLRGTVASQSARMAAVTAARGVPGVAAVEDELRVRPVG